MPKVYIADKETLDNVKQDTQYIRSQFPLQVSGGIDWGKYDSSIIEKNLKIKDKGKTTLLEIEGKGYVNYIFAQGGNGYLIITIDNKQVLNGYFADSPTSNSVYPGIYNVNNLQATETSSGSNIYVDSLSFIGRNPKVDNDNNYKFFNNKLFFNNKVKVEINPNENKANIILHYNIGVEK